MRAGGAPTFVTGLDLCRSAASAKPRHVVGLAQRFVPPGLTWVIPMMRTPHFGERLTFSATHIKVAISQIRHG